MSIFKAVFTAFFATLFFPNNYTIRLPVTEPNGHSNTDPYEMEAPNHPPDNAAFKCTNTST